MDKDLLSDMNAKNNSLEGMKEKYKEAIIDVYRETIEKYNRGEIKGGVKEVQSYFDSMHFEKAMDDSLGSNPRWGIVGRKNLFGLKAILLPGKGFYEKYASDGSEKIGLIANSGRFQMQKFMPVELGEKSQNIIGVLSQDEGQQFTELEEFYNMNNREVFEKYGMSVASYKTNNNEMNFIANCLILDTLLKDKYSEIELLECTSDPGYRTRYKLNDGTIITAESISNCYDFFAEKGITIKTADGRETRVDFDAKNIGNNKNYLTNLNDLEIENIKYYGDPELSTRLKEAIKEQFFTYEKKELDENKTDENEFDENGIHRITGEKYDAFGYDKNGFDRWYLHKDTGTEYDENGFNKYGFNKDGISRDTGTKYNSRGFYVREDLIGFEDLFTVYDILNKNTNSIYDQNGFNIDGYNKAGYDKDGYNEYGFNEKGIHRITGKKFNPYGYDKDGFDEEGRYIATGLTREEMEKELNLLIGEDKTLDEQIEEKKGKEKSSEEEMNKD